MVALKGKPDIGDQINKKIIAPLANANKLSDFPDFNDAAKLGSGKEMVDRLTNLIAIFENPALDFSKNRAEGDDILSDMDAELAADQGHATAQRLLGAMYANGLGVTQDYAEAVRWYRLAADQGDADAQYNLGMSYNNGEGLPQDDVAAHMWLNLAASQSSRLFRETYVKARDAVAAQMTPEEIAEAQRLAREWKPTVEP